MKMIGIVDALGIESFIPLESHQREAFMFSLRSKANHQRNAVSFVLTLHMKKLIRSTAL